MNLRGYNLIQTCGAYPEQYEVYDESNTTRLAYLRLRHGRFYVAVPDVGGEHIYEANPEGDGYFTCDEREKYLQEAIDAINSHYLKLKYNYTMNNIFILEPTRSRYGIWTFDDVNTGLVQEPFVGETNDLIDLMVREKGHSIQDASKGIALMFSPEPFPGYQSEIVLTETSPHGSTYHCEKWNINPWLCPALYRYFPAAPQRLFSMIKF